MRFPRIIKLSKATMDPLITMCLDFSTTNEPTQNGRTTHARRILIYKCSYITTVPAIRNITFSWQIIKEETDVQLEQVKQIDRRNTNSKFLREDSTQCNDSQHLLSHISLDYISDDSHDIVPSL